MADLQIATLNLRYATPQDGGNAWSNRKEQVVDHLRDIDADVVALQEALPEQFSYLRERFPEYSWFGRGRDGTENSEHVPVGYRTDRFDRVDAGAFWLSRTPNEPSVGWDGSCPRLATWIDLDDGQTLFRFLSTHLDHEGERARVKGADLIADHVRQCPFASIVAGDFNASPESEPLSRLTTDALCDAQRTAETVSGPDGTFHGFDGDPRERIDYVLVSEQFQVRTAKTIGTDQPHPSDHFAVVVDVTY